jgi:subtilisin family serine protease
LQSTDPNGVGVTGSARLPRAIGGTLTPLAYIGLTSASTVTFATWPTFTFVLPSNVTIPAGAGLYLAYNPGDTAGNWSTLAGPATLNGSTVTFSPTSGPVTFRTGTTYAFALISTAQPLVVATPSPSPSPTATATASPGSTAFTCPTTGTASFVRSGATVEKRRAPFRGTRSGTPSATMLAVTYDRATAQTSAVQIASRERALGVQFVQSYDFVHQNITMRVVSVPTSSLAAAEAALRAQGGVRSVAVTGERRYRSTTSAVYTNDPYFQGFAANNSPLPYSETATVPGQWDMHAIGLENAFGYSQTGVGYTPNISALGSSSIKIAIIDTGEDASHPELNSKISYQHCYITNDAGTAQSSGTFSTDEDGHGTDVSGIAAAASGNALGFVGAGGKSVIYAYRVFPTPDDTCASDAGSDDNCSASTADIASAINDAVNVQHVNVISMSLGGGGCTAGGVDTDTVEGAAVANAIASNVIVVAASGNSGPSPAVVTAPGCDTGVIAVGATSLSDGQATGTSDAGSYSTTRAPGTALSPVEYVASYSQFGTTNTLGSASSWGIVAPGGDPSNADLSGTADDLHWIENIWTSTPFMSSPSDQNFAGNCNGDYPSTTTVNPDCRTLIAGTSMATPHVAGAVALILAVNSTYQSPSAMKQLLCTTADDLGDTHQGCGRLNVYRAMSTAMHDTSPP